MNCLEFRRSVGAEPHIETEALRAHATTCASCARYWGEMKQMDGLIHRALSVEPPAAAAHGAPITAGKTRYWAAAASFIIAVALGSFLWLVQPRESFAEQLVEHVQHEAASLVRTPARVDASELTSIMAESGVRLKPGSMQVSYAMSCWFRERRVPHLVVQTEEGPVTVLVLRHEAEIAGPQQFEENGFSGVIIPAPEGVLAVLAQEASAPKAAKTVLDALEYFTPQQ